MEEGKQTSLTASHKIPILATVHEHIGICDDLETKLRLPVSKANTTVQFHTATGIYIQWALLQATDSTATSATGRI